MIELLFICAIGSKPLAPCPPPPPPTEERLVGLPGREIIFSAVETEEADGDFRHIVPKPKDAKATTQRVNPKLKDAKATTQIVNRRGNRNH